MQRIILVFLIIFVINSLYSITTWEQPREIGELVGHNFYCEGKSIGDYYISCWTQNDNTDWYFQKIDADGNRIWGDDGIEIPEFSDYLVLSIDGGLDGSFFVTYYSEEYLGIAKINSNGGIVWNLPNAAYHMPWQTWSTSKIFITPENGVKIIHRTSEAFMLVQISPEGQIEASSELCPMTSPTDFVMDNIGGLYMLVDDWFVYSLSYFDNTGEEQFTISVPDTTSEQFTYCSIYPTNQGVLLLSGDSSCLRVYKYLQQDIVWEYTSDFIPYIESGFLCSDEAGNVYIVSRPSWYELSTKIVKLNSEGQFQWEYLTPQVVWGGTRTYEQPVANANGVLFSYKVTPEMGSSLFAINFISTDGQDFWDKQIVTSYTTPAFYTISLVNMDKILITRNRHYYDIFDLFGTSILPDGERNLFIWDKGAMSKSYSVINAGMFNLLGDSYEGDLWLKCFDNQGENVFEENHKVLLDNGQAKLKGFNRINEETMFLYWLEENSTQTSKILKCQFINNNGDLLLAEDGLLLNSTIAYNSYVSECFAFVSANEVYIYWTSGNQVNREIYGQHFVSGNMQWEPNGRLIISSTETPTLLNAKNGYLMYETFSNGEYSFKVLRVNDQGLPADGWTSAGISISTSDQPYDNDFGVVAEQLNDSLLFTYDDKLQIIKPDGSLYFANSQDLNSNRALQILVDEQVLYVLKRNNNDYYVHELQKYSMHESGLQEYWDSALVIPNTSAEYGLVSLIGNGVFILSNDSQNTNSLVTYIDGNQQIEQIPFITANKIEYPCSGSLLDENKAFVTAKISNNGNLYDVLQCIISDSLGIHVEEINPSSLKKLSIYPNPFNPTTTISYSLQTEALVEINVYNVKGQLVKQLRKETVPAGNHKVVWNGKNSAGQNCSSGLYFCKMQTGKTTLTKKMMLIK